MNRDSHETPELSIVTTVYNLARFAPEFARRAAAAAAQVAGSYEIIFINDGSPDDAEQVIGALCAQDPNIVLVNLSRNFGHHHAVMAGLAQARGRRVFLLDGDLEEKPEWLLDFHKTQTEGNWDVVYGVQRQRKGGGFEVVSGALFWKTINLLSDTEIPANIAMARLMTRPYVDALLGMGERNLFLGGMFSWLGFKQTALEVDKGHRDSGSSYSLSRKISLAANAIASFSSKPLKIIFYLGGGIASLGFLYGLYVIIHKLVVQDAVVSGWSSLIASIWFLGGLNIMFLGAIGLYISKIYNEVKSRPVYVVRSVVRGKT